MSVTTAQTSYGMYHLCKFLLSRLTRGVLVMTEVSQSRSRLLKTTRATMVVFWYSFGEWGAPSGYIRRMVVREPASLLKPGTGALFSLGTNQSHFCLRFVFSQHSSHPSDTGTPDNDVILVDMGAKMAPMKNPSIADHHASPATALSAQ